MSGKKAKPKPPDMEVIRALSRRLLLRLVQPKFAEPKRRVPFLSIEIEQVLRGTKHILITEPMLIEMRPPLIIVGDIHGQYLDLLHIFEMFSTNNRDISSKKKRDDADDNPAGENWNGFICENYLFLGDYVDRGPRQIEVIMLLFVCKILWPRQYGLLRGNHENAVTNLAYGFEQELNYRFYDGNSLWHQFNNVFAMLPVAARVGRRILCMHGGLSKGMKSLDDIRRLKKPVRSVFDVMLVRDLLWSDPAPGRGFSKNHKRNAGWLFGENEVRKFCARMKLDLIVRGHQCVQNGFRFFCGRKLLTLFSAPRYAGSGRNIGAVLVVRRDGRLSIRQFRAINGEDPGPDRYNKDYCDGLDDDSNTKTGSSSRASPPPSQPPHLSEKLPG
ncbi:unnamed protein product, partial [Mesorhabditis spiculigera]